MTTWVAIQRTSAVPVRPAYSLVKRIFDVTLCLAALPVVMLVALIIGALIRIESPGPAIFVQERIGRGGRPFMMYKFRTMYHNISREAHCTYMKAYVNGQTSATSSLSVFKPYLAEQVTRIGRLLRATSLDELPQIVNVLKGEMSLVGPRPNVIYEVEEYKAWHRERLEVLPGITGLAQVRGRSGITFQEIIRYDILYIERRSLFLDLKILWWTVVSVLQQDGAK